jgi:hypothetical protein
MELEGLSTKLKLEEGITSSSGSSVEDVQSNAPDSESHFRVSIQENFANVVICTYHNNSLVLVRKRTIPTERLLLVGEVNASFC